ncbi:MAG: hypothetical protein IPM69_03465 [Ignavibacteria bacterium]|nr:hypothetical protein [Ignavibacteria bacterium]
MNTIVNKIMAASGYSEESFAGIERYYSKEDNAFFFVIQYSIDDISGLRKYSQLTEKDNYKGFLESFNTLIKEGQSNKIEKNSSLLVLVKSETLEAIGKYHQQILLLKEDEYFFKKYVILYTDATVSVLSQKLNLLNYLHEKLKDEVSFSKYAKQGYCQDIEDYLMVIQLFIKLPPLNVQIGGENFKALHEKISETLNENDEGFINWILENEEQISKLDFKQENAEGEIEALLNRLPNDQN